MSSKNVNWVGIKNLQKTIKKLGIKDKELECEGASNISQLLTGAKAITEKVSAPALVKKINEIVDEKGIDLGFEVTVDLLRGKINIISNDILKELEKEVKDNNISEKTIKNIDNNSSELSKDELIIFLNDTIQILNKNIYANANLIRKYAKKILKLNLDINVKIKAYQQLIRAYRGLRSYDEIISVAETIADDLELYKDEDVKASCYSNIAFAYYKEKKYEESIYYFKKLKPLGEYDEFFYLTLESNIFAMKKEFDKAQKGYLKVLKKAKNESNNDYVVDVYSNLAIMYKEMELEYEAKDCIDNALNYINCGTAKTYRFNTYLNACRIYNEFYDDEFEKVEEFFFKAFPLAIELNNIDKLNLLLETLFNRYFEIKDYDKIYKILDQVKGLNISPKILFSVIENMKK